jgi:eukaryotic-like serine/threonine-protein kinase
MKEPAASSGAQERDIFIAALELASATEREAYVRQACAGDEALRLRVATLLNHHQQDSFLESPAVASRWTPPTGGKTQTETAAPIIERPGDRISHYKLLQVIGEGGAGTVFMADQEEPIRRRVALKVIKPGMDTASVIARFETERQALAMMDHPNIAKVFDAGTTLTGRPFFVMELVPGIRITDFCDQNHLATRERLQLFIKVCHAIQHAHQKGIIHRDVKPSNILVTLHDGVPVPKVIDFGIAKATGQRLTDKTLFTEFRSLIGTPAYMSPEQAEMSGLDIDTRTDIYSLGVLLYQLITGKTPFDPRELLDAGLDNMRRTILEKEPVRPSTRLSELPDQEITTTAACRQVEPARLVNQINGDLDWIVMKALDKDRMRRYQTANDLAMDIQRHLDNEPVVARPPSIAYQFQRLVRRHKLAFAAASAFASALVLGLALSTWQYLEKSSAYERLLEAEHQQRGLREKAQKAHARELELRRQAERQELAALRKAYAADINLARHALEINNLGRAQALLTQQRPVPGHPDMRGWEWRYLWQKCRSDALFTLGRLSNEVHAIAVSHDGKWAATMESGKGALGVWDLRARQEIARFASGESRGLAVFSPQSPLLAFSETERIAYREFRHRVRLWDVSARQYAGDLPLTGFCQGLAFSEDGKSLMIASGGRLEQWDVTDKKTIASHPLFRLGRSDVAVQVSRDFRFAAFVVNGGEISVVDLEQEQVCWSVQAAEENVKTLAFSPDGKILASGAGFTESDIRLWNVATGEEVARLGGHRAWVSSLVFWPDGQTLASASADQTIRLWNLAELHLASPPVGSENSGQKAKPEVPQGHPFATLQGHQLEVWSLALLPDKTTLISGCKDGAVCVWDVTMVRHNRSAILLPVEVRAWSFSPDSQAVLALDRDGRISRWQGVDFQDAQTLLEVQGRIFHAIFSLNGRLVALAVDNGGTQVWDLQEHALVREFKAAGTPVIPVTFIPNSNHLVVQYLKDSSSHELDPVTGVETRTWNFPPEFRFRNHIAYSPSCEWSVAYNDEGDGYLRHLPGDRQTPIDLNIKQITQISFSPDEKCFAVVSGTGIGGLWATDSAAKITGLQGFLLGMGSVTFSPDGKRVAIGSNAKEAVKLWETDGLQELLTLEGQGSGFASTAFSPDGNILGSSNFRGKLHLWRTLSMEEIQKIEDATH